MSYTIFEEAGRNAACNSAETRVNTLPPLGTVAQAGAFGAVLAGATSGAVNAMRVRNGEISRDHAIQETARAAAGSAASMAIASVAAHVVRAHPVFGLAALAAVGIFALGRFKADATGQAAAPAAAE